MVLTGKINTRLVAEVNLYISEGPGNGVKGIGLSGEDAQLLTVKSINVLELGFVGEVEKINPEILNFCCWRKIISRLLLRLEWTKKEQDIILMPILLLGRLAISLKAEKLIFLS